VKIAGSAKSVQPHKMLSLDQEASSCAVPRRGEVACVPAGEGHWKLVKLALMPLRGEVTERRITCPQFQTQLRNADRKLLLFNIFTQGGSAGGRYSTRNDGLKHLFLHLSLVC